MDLDNAELVLPMNPRKKRQATRPPKFWQAAVAPEITPQTIIQHGRYIAGFPVLFRNRLEGICMRLVEEVSEANWQILMKKLTCNRQRESRP